MTQWLVFEQKTERRRNTDGSIREVPQYHELTTVDATDKPTAEAHARALYPRLPLLVRSRASVREDTHFWDLHRYITR